MAVHTLTQLRNIIQLWKTTVVHSPLLHRNLVPVQAQKVRTYKFILVSQKLKQAHFTCKICKLGQVASCKMQSLCISAFYFDDFKKQYSQTQLSSLSTHIQASSLISQKHWLLLHTVCNPRKVLKVLGMNLSLHKSEAFQSWQDFDHSKYRCPPSDGTSA